MRRKYIVGITGASGSIYAIRLLEELVERNCEVHLVVSTNGFKVFKYETEISVEDFIKKLSNRIVLHANDNLFAPIASGSFKTDGMAIVPCSMSTLGEIACGVSKSLLGRAADVCIKERRRLVLVPRETPLSSIHLKNMLTLSEMGVTMLPAMPGFYNKPVNIVELIDSIVGRVLDSMGIRNNLYNEWGT